MVRLFTTYEGSLNIKREDAGLTSRDEQERERVRALEALGAFQKQGRSQMGLEDLQAILNDESDRGLIVIMGSWLEDQLLAHLLPRFKALEASQRKDLIRPGGLLNTFADKVTLAMAMELIDQETVDKIKVIQTMRNACAHCRRNITFASKQLLDVFALSFADDPWMAQNIREEDGTGRHMLRLIFVLMNIYLHARVQGNDKDRATETANAILDTIIGESATKPPEASLKKRSARPKKSSPTLPKE